MNEIMAIIITIIGSVLTLLIGIVGFFLRKLLNDFSSLKKGVESLTIGMNSVQSDLNNNTKEVSEIKTSLKSLEKDITRRLDKQAEKIEWNRDNIIKLQSGQENCPARNKII